MMKRFSMMALVAAALVTGCSGTSTGIGTNASEGSDSASATSQVAPCSADGSDALVPGVYRKVFEYSRDISVVTLAADCRYCDSDSAVEHSTKAVRSWTSSWNDEHTLVYVTTNARFDGEDHTVDWMFDPDTGVLDLRYQHQSGVPGWEPIESEPICR